MKLNSEGSRLDHRSRSASLPALRTRRWPGGLEPERWVVPVGVWSILAMTTWTQGDAAGQAESAYLGLLIAGVLAALAAFRGRGGPAPELAPAALLTTLVVWLAYQGAPRGAAVTAILVIGLASAFARLWLGGELEKEGSLDRGVTVALALAFQLLVRSDLLLAPLLAPRTLVSVVLLPAVAGWAVSNLSIRFGSRPALLAAGAAAVLAPGLTVTSTLALAALAAGVVAGDRGASSVLKWTALAALALLPLWNLPRGILFAAAGLSLTVRSRSSSWTAPVVLFSGVLVAVLSPQAHAPMEALRHWLGALLLVPAGLLAVVAGRWRVRLGIVLSLAAAMVSGAPEAMAAGVALIALSIPEAGEVVALQGLWCAIFVTGATLLGAYPWVRDDPIGDLLALLGWRTEVEAFLWLMLLVAGLGTALERLRPWWRAQPSPALLAGLLLGLALLRGAAPAEVVLNSYDAVTLDERSDRFRREIPPQRVSAVVLDTHLIQGATLAPGTPVARVVLRGTDREVLGEWTLHSGTETAEWAAARPDVGERMGFVSPPPWISVVAPDGSFFSRRYRTRLELQSDVPDGLQEAGAVAILRDPGLPPEARLTVYRLELRP